MTKKSERAKRQGIIALEEEPASRRSRESSPPPVTDDGCRGGQRRLLLPDVAWPARWLKRPSCRLELLILYSANFSSSASLSLSLFFLLEPSVFPALFSSVNLLSAQLVHRES